jgi:hypothetical protein
VCSKAYEGHDRALRKTIRYEDLLADPDGVLTGLSEWLGLPHGEARIREVVARNAFAEVPEKRRGPGRRWRAASPGRWRESLTPPELDVVRKVMGPRLSELGYADQHE